MLTSDFSHTILETSKKKKSYETTKKTIPEPLASYITMTKLCVIACPYIRNLYKIYAMSTFCSVFLNGITDAKGKYIIGSIVVR